VTSTVVIGGYCTLPECLMTITRRANSAKVLRSSTSAKLYSYETLRERLAQDLRHMAAALGPCIQEAHAVVGQRHFARQRYGPPRSRAIRFARPRNRPPRRPIFDHTARW
jgi:hypothetical protein